MSNNIINFGIIGHGFMGHVHEKMLGTMDGIRVAAIADIENTRLEDVKNGIKRYNNPSGLINDPEVQVVLAAANNNQHHRLVQKAHQRAGKAEQRGHVLPAVIPPGPLFVSFVTVRG